MTRLCLAVLIACHSGSQLPSPDGAPEVPAPALTASPGYQTVHLVWTPVAGATSYDVTRDGAQLTSVTATTLDDAMVATFERHTYTVRAEAGAASNEATSFAYDFDHWTVRRSGLKIHDVASGNGLSIAVGDGGRMLRSTDSTSWTVMPSLPMWSTNGVVFAGNQFVAVGYPRADDGAAIFTSPDGITWTPRDSGTTQALEDITYAYSGNAVLVTPIYIAVGTDGAIVTSSDGVTWTATNCDDKTFHTIAVVQHTSGSGAQTSYRFMALAAGQGTVCYSTDGASWDQVDFGGGNYQGAVAADASGTIIAVDYGAQIFRATYDFTANTFSDTENELMPLGPIYTGVSSYTDTVRHLVASTLDGHLYTSLDGHTWSMLPAAASGAVSISNVVAASGALWLLGDHEAMYRSTDGGQTMTSLRHLDAPARYMRVAHADGRTLVAPVNDPYLAVSTDNASFTDAPIATQIATYPLVAAGSGGYAVVYQEINGASLQVAHSSDAVTWTVTGVDTPSATMLNVGGAARIEGGQLVASLPLDTAGAPNLWLTGSASAGYSAVDSGEAHRFTQLWRTPDGYHALDGADVYASTDGKHWSNLSTAPVSNAPVAVVDAGDRRWVADGAGNVSSTADDVAWSPATQASTTQLTAMTRLGDHLVAVGWAGTIVTSPDGVTWTVVTPPVYAQLTGVTATDRGLVIAGADGVVITAP
jgi:hypothetical protein